LEIRFDVLDEMLLENSVMPPEKKPATVTSPSETMEGDKGRGTSEGSLANSAEHYGIR